MEQLDLTAIKPRLVPRVSDGHTAAAFVTFQEGKKPTEEQIKEIWKNFKGRAQELDLPSAPKQFIHYFEEPDRPQAHTERELEGGMAISAGRRSSGLNLHPLGTFN